jgi:hypothetical protein
MVGLCRQAWHSILLTRRVRSPQHSFTQNNRKNAGRQLEVSFRQESGS